MKSENLGYVILGVVVATAFIGIWLATNAPGAGRAVDLAQDEMCYVKGYGLDNDGDVARSMAVSDANRRAREACPGMVCNIIEQNYVGDEATVLFACR